MNGCWLALLLCAAPPAAAPAESPAVTAVTPSRPAKQSAEDQSAAAAEPREFYESDPETDARLQAAYALKARIGTALKTEAKTKDAEHDAAVCELAAVYCALQNSPPLAEEELLRLRTQVRSRLQKIARQLKSAEKRKPSGESAPLSPESIAALQAARAAVSAELGGGAGGAAQQDYGKDLVELIETVIAPNTWEKNGGFGSIYYFSPLQVIVVRSTGEVHGHVGGVIGNLRAAGN